jgi:hypothetical protein
MRRVKGGVPLRFLERYLCGWYRPELPLPANRRYARVALLVEGRA